MCPKPARWEPGPKRALTGTQTLEESVPLAETVAKHLRINHDIDRHRGLRLKGFRALGLHRSGRFTLSEL